MAKKNTVTMQDRIKNLQPYFLGIEIKENLYIMRIALPNKWSAYNSDDERIKATKSDTNKNEWFYYADVNEADLNEIFDLVEDTIRTNESVTKKIELMRVRMGELKELFQKESLERLMSLKFTFDEVKQPKRSYRKKQIFNNEMAKLASKETVVQDIPPLDVSNEPIKTQNEDSAILYNNSDIDNITL